MLRPVCFGYVPGDLREFDVSNILQQEEYYCDCSAISVFGIRDIFVFKVVDFVDVPMGRFAGDERKYQFCSDIRYR